MSRDGIHETGNHKINRVNLLERPHDTVNAELGPVSVGLFDRAI